MGTAQVSERPAILTIVGQIATTRAFLAIEYVLLFVGLPTLFYYGTIRVSGTVALCSLGAVSLIALVNDPSFRRENLWSCRCCRSEVTKIFLRMILACAGIAVLTLAIAPNDLFRFPREQPLVWLGFVLGYPLLSAYPQELMYRGFFFHRYKALFPGSGLLIFSNTIAFSFLHIVYGNIIAIALSLIGGYFFSKTYHRTGSLLITGIEHTLYGCFIFSVGLGNFFVK